MKRSKTTLWLMLACGVLSSGQAQADDCTFPACPSGGTYDNCTCVDDVTQLENAIRCEKPLICLTNSQYTLSSELSQPEVDLAIEGKPGSALTGNGSSRLISVDKTSISFNKLEITNFSAGDGGVVNSDNGTVTIQNSTLAGNSATGRGGAIYSDKGTVTIQDSTLTGNSATGQGGAIYSDNGTVTIQNSTLTDDNAIHIDTGKGGSGTVTSSILTGSDPCNGVSSGGNNLISSKACGFAAGKGDLCCGGSSSCPDSCGVPDTLLRNGGPTRTLALAYDSPAMGNGACSQGSTDQRGVPRFDARTGEDSCDVGAYETMCSVDTVDDNTLEINVYLDFENPTASGAYTVMNSSACQVSPIPNGTAEIHWKVFPFNGITTTSSQKMQIFNIYQHTTCHESATGTGCTSLEAGKQPEEGCDDCVDPCIFKNATHASEGEIAANAIGTDGKLFYKITGVDTSFISEEGGIEIECQDPPLPAPGCDQEDLPVECTEVKEGDSWWYTVQWSQTVNEGSWDPRMECPVQ